MGWQTVLGTPLSGLPVRNAQPGPVEQMYSLHTRLLASSLRILTSSEMDVILGFWERRVSLAGPPALPSTCCTRCLLGLGWAAPPQGPSLPCGHRRPRTGAWEQKHRLLEAGTGGFPGRGLPSGSASAGPEIPPSARVPRLLGDRSAPL